MPFFMRLIQNYVTGIRRGGLLHISAKHSQSKSDNK